MLPPFPLSQMPYFSPSAPLPLQFEQLPEVQLHVVPPLGRLPTVHVPEPELEPDPELELLPELELELELDDPELELLELELPELELPLDELELLDPELLLDEAPELPELLE